MHVWGISPSPASSSIAVNSTLISASSSSLTTTVHHPAASIAHSLPLALTSVSLRSTGYPASTLHLLHLLHERGWIYLTWIHAHGHHLLHGVHHLRRHVRHASLHSLTWLLLLLATWARWHAWYPWHLSSCEHRFEMSSFVSLRFDGVSHRLLLHAVCGPCEFVEAIVEVVGLVGARPSPWFVMFRQI